MTEIITWVLALQAKSGTGKRISLPVGGCCYGPCGDLYVWPGGPYIRKPPLTAWMAWESRVVEGGRKRKPGNAPGDDIGVNGYVGGS